MRHLAQLRLVWGACLILLCGVGQSSRLSAAPLWSEPGIRQVSDLSDGWELAPVQGWEAIRTLGDLGRFSRDGWRSVMIPNLGDGKGFSTSTRTRKKRAAGIAGLSRSPRCLATSELCCTSGRLAMSRESG